ncbi:exported hypothetical protein [Mesorhizobium plurifarium]|uniref:Uncharacterized protein n=1 Tax=Mesorhizobium plurifarium TaxID=69974 RepID=A0A090GD67_MESPL|nr:exported hypothetical protein [Mesorhizobium plurifarium]
MRIFCLLAATALLPMPCKAEGDIYHQANVAWAAYKCAAFAFNSRMPNADGEHRRLVEKGYQNGLTFFSAPRAEMLASDSVVPTELGLVALDFRSVEYSLGRIEEIANRYALNEISSSFGTDVHPSFDEWKAAALRLYKSGNCDLL